MKTAGYVSFLIFHFSFLIGHSTLAADATVRFKPAVSIENTIVTLGDVADVAGADDETSAKLKSVQLVPAPVPGKTLRLEFGVVRSRLQAHGINLAELDFAGHSVVVVRRSESGSSAPATAAGAQAAPADWKQKRAERLISDAIREHCTRLAPELGVVQVAVALQPEDIDRVVTADSQTVSVAGAAVPSGEAQPLRVRVGHSGRAGEIQVTASVTPWPWVLAANVDLPAGHRLRTADLAWAQVESADGLFAEVERLAGQETAQPVRAGQPIRASDVRSVPLVRNGDIVSVTSRRAGISVRRAMKARGDGALGEEITVTTLDGRDRLTARVTGFHEAEVGSHSPAAQVDAPSGIRVVTEREPAGMLLPQTTLEAHPRMP